MHWLQTLDVSVFRAINLGLSNPVCDQVMPFVSGNAFFYPALILLAAWLVWKGRARGTVCVLMLIFAVALSDGVVCRAIKEAVGRQRPFMVMTDVHRLVGQASSGSMPSGHASNWFAATIVALIYYRRSLWFVLPVAAIVSLSRVYNGVHYPSDILVGAILGAGSGAAAVLVSHMVWRWAGQKWFPLWWQKLPSLLDFSERTQAVEAEQAMSAPIPSRAGKRWPAPSPHAELDQHWLRAGYLLIAVVVLVRLVYIASNTIQLAEDEAYQWLWSKHLALSYYSKPPLIAYTQFLGTGLWGDTAFGVRFFAPLISGVIGIMVLRFMAREVNARAGFSLLLILTATPLLAVGGVLMTIDPLSVLFWTAAMVAGWRAIQENAPVRYWLWVGLWMGLGFLSKYTVLFQWLCWAIFFLLWPPARKHWRHPGPYLALLLNIGLALPVLIWNYQHDWITVRHVAEDAGSGTHWRPTLAFVRDFLGSEAALLNPVFFVAALWAAVALWQRNRHNPRLIYLFSMGAPLFLVYLLQSLRYRVLPNWIAPAVVPLFCLMVVYWDTQWRLGLRIVKTGFTAGLALGLTLVILGHHTDLIGKLTGGHLLPINLDPLHRVRQWKEVARLAGDARQELAAEGKPVFIIGDHYGLVSEISFYLPEARKAVTDQPLVYYKSSTFPRNQFFFWPGYGALKGQNAIFIRELDRGHPQPKPAPESLQAEFESVAELDTRSVLYHGHLLRPLQIFACRGLR